MKVKEVADLVGISVRTLHHYDEIGLLKPKKTEAGYRIYTDEDLDTLQQILFFRELGFPLKTIKEIMNSPSYDRQEALEMQRNILIEKRKRLEEMITTIDKTLQHMRGEITMSKQEKFKGFDFSHNPYEEEARRRWGDNAVDKSNARLEKMTDAERTNLQEKMSEVFVKLAEIRHLPPESEEAQAVIHQWYELLNHIGTYTLEAFKGLGQLYIMDERFTKNIDQFGEGLAQFMCDAMAHYADERTK